MQYCLRDAWDITFNILSKHFNYDHNNQNKIKTTEMTRRVPLAEQELIILP